MQTYIPKICSIFTWQTDVLILRYPYQKQTFGKYVRDAIPKNESRMNLMQEEEHLRYMQNGSGIFSGMETEWTWRRRKSIFDMCRMGQRHFLRYGNRMNLMQEEEHLRYVQKGSGIFSGMGAGTEQSRHRRSASADQTGRAEVFTMRFRETIIQNISITRRAGEKCR